MYGAQQFLLQHWKLNKQSWVQEMTWIPHSLLLWAFWSKSSKQPFLTGQQWSWIKNKTKRSKYLQQTSCPDWGVIPAEHSGIHSSSGTCAVKHRRVSSRSNLAKFHCRPEPDSDALQETAFSHRINFQTTSIPAVAPTGVKPHTGRRALWLHSNAKHHLKTPSKEEACLLLVPPPTRQLQRNFPYPPLVFLF